MVVDESHAHFAMGATSTPIQTDHVHQREVRLEMNPLETADQLLSVSGCDVTFGKETFYVLFT